MLSSDQNIETVRQLCLDLKAYAELRAKALQLDVVSKLAVVVTALIVGGVLFLLFMIVVLFLSGMAALALAPHVGGTAVACGLVALAYALLGLLLYTKRKAWILNPVSSFIGRLFLQADADEEFAEEDMP